MKIFFMILGILFLILGICLLFGKGTFLIAGYNTMSKEEKAKVDTKKLTRIMAFIVLFVAFIFIMIVFDVDSIAYMVIPLVIIVFSFIVFGQRYILNEDGKKEYDQKSHTLNKVIGSIFIVVIAFVTYVLMFTGDISVQYNDDYIIFDGGFKEMSIKIDAIDDLYIKEDIDEEFKVNGFSNQRVLAGRFKNDTYGEHYLYAYKDAEAYLVIKRDNVYIIYGDELKKVKDVMTYIEERKV